jgi:hypothetical protein
MASHDWVPGDSGGSKYFQGITHKGGAHCVPEGRIPFHDVCLLGGLALSLAVRCYATALLRSLKLHAVHAGTACCSCMIRGSSVDQWAVMGNCRGKRTLGESAGSLLWCCHVTLHTVYGP